MTVVICLFSTVFSWIKNTKGSKQTRRGQIRLILNNKNQTHGQKLKNIACMTCQQDWEQESASATVGADVDWKKIWGPKFEKNKCLKDAQNDFSDYNYLFIYLFFIHLLPHHFTILEEKRKGNWWWENKGTHDSSG